MWTPVTFREHAEEMLQDLTKRLRLPCDTIIEYGLERLAEIAPAEPDKSKHQRFMRFLAELAASDPAPPRPRTKERKVGVPNIVGEGRGQ